MTTSRRTLLRNSAAAAAALSFDWTRAQAQAETVRIGVVYDLTGPFAAGGSVACSIGTDIAIDLCNERGGIGGNARRHGECTDLHRKRYERRSALHRGQVLEENGLAVRC